ncbi:MAG: DNA repair protein [Idiomarina sp. 34-48-12]|nr:MAG: DNA repair protein [Idiomarina sp. 34-48-12]
MNWIGIVFVVVVLAGCQSAYYGAMEKVGIHKRDILVDRVDDARDAQTDAQEEFKSALQRLDELLQFDGGELEARYNALNDDYESSKAAAERVYDRIEAIDDVAQALFDEWQEELGMYSNDSMRRESERSLRETERRYTSLLQSMERAADTMEPVLEKLQDNVLYLKHNLNAKAVDAIRGEYRSLRTDVDVLIREMETAIQESNAFIEAMQEGS